MRQAPSSAASAKTILLVGSGYGALKVAQDLAQSGLPLVWVTKAPHFLELPGGVRHFTEWPDDLDYQFRPLYLQVTRHPLVRAMTRARVEALTPAADGYRAVIVREPVYINYDLCTGCGRCMDACPLKDADHPPLGRTPASCPSRALDLDKRGPEPCRTRCPLGVKVPAYMALTAAGRFEEALDVIRADNPLPGICGRVCHHPCEEACRRAELDQAVAVRSVKRFLADRDRSRRPQLSAAVRHSRPERVAVVGSGPAGLTAAYFLNQEGFTVTVFEEHVQTGGMLRIGINAFRLPRDILDTEIEAIAASGVAIRTGTKVSSLEDLRDEGFDAILLCTGAHEDLRLNVPDEDAKGVLGVMTMLGGLHTGAPPEVRGHVSVIGGGNAAVDAARAAVRLGAESVTICYRRQREDMPASAAEISAAEEEGVIIACQVAPVRIISRKGRVVGVELIRMAPGAVDKSGRRSPEPVPGSEFRQQADTLVVAIGQRPRAMMAEQAGPLASDVAGRLCVDEKTAAVQRGVFAAGDVVTGPATVVGAMAQGRRAAAEIAAYLTGSPPAWAPSSQEERGAGDYREIPAETPRRWRPAMPERQPKVRRQDFAEVELGFTERQAVEEAQRCLQCGTCCECRLCEEECRDVGAIDHFQMPRRLTVTSPAVIVAADEEASHLGLDGAAGVYHVGDFRRATDLVNVLIAGSASAAQAMAQCRSLRTNGLSPRVQEAPAAWDERFGLFLCTCNDTLAAPGALAAMQRVIAGMPQIRHSETVFSACHPRGADRIAAAVQKHKLGRVILASCVCCPLEFQCISCNDQRNRARIHLFDRLGLDRSRFEMINVKDHLGNGTVSEKAMRRRMRDFLQEALLRSRFMGPLRQGITKIGNRILILGGSEVGLSCALNLDMQGFKVHLVHRCRLKDGAELPREIAQRQGPLLTAGTITHTEEALVEGIKGHLGDFTVMVRENGSRRQFRADIVCLADINVLSLAIPVGMFGLKKFYRYNFKFFHSPQTGIYRVMPRTLARVTAFQAGAALAAHVATTAAEAFLKDHELSPRVDKDRCRGCGKCTEICPFDAVRLVPNEHGFFTADVLRHNCVGCGGCVGRCPVTAMDMPYFGNRLLQEIVASTLAEEQ